MAETNPSTDAATTGTMSGQPQAEGTRRVVPASRRPAQATAGAPTSGTERRRLPVLALLTFALTQLVLLFWWAACHPGRFSPDSLDYMWQSTTGNWNTHHPISYTALVWLSLQLTNGVAALTLAQATAMAAGLAYAVTGLRRLGGPGWLWVTVAVAVVILPPVGVFLMAVWKDVAFVICHVFLLGTLARLLAHRRDHRSGALGRRLPPVILVPLVIELTLICLFRQNGFISVLITVGLCLLLLRGSIRWLAPAGAGAVSVALLTNWLLLPALGVPKSESIVAFESFFSDIAIAYAADPDAFTPAETAILGRVASLAHWRDSGNCYQVDSTVYHPEFDRRAAVVHRDELLTVWWQAALRSPGTIAQARVCRGSIAWRPTPAGGLSRNPSAWGLRVYLDRNPNFRASPFAHAAYSRPLDDRIAKMAGRLSARVDRPDWLLWRGATWAYVTYLVVGLIAWRRRDHELLALATITVGLQTSVLLFNAVQAARYMAAPFVLGILILPLLAARRPPNVGGGTPAELPTANDAQTEVLAAGNRVPTAGTAGAGQAQARFEERG